uniref:Uncharacterized protein n=1 Tax=Anguilla anguilla TaxID=7936 RepID=A0A0E9WT83_ANGAN
MLTRYSWVKVRECLCTIRNQFSVCFLKPCHPLQASLGHLIQTLGDGERGFVSPLLGCCYNELPKSPISLKAKPTEMLRISIRNHRNRLSARGSSTHFCRAVCSASVKCIIAFRFGSNRCLELLHFSLRFP